MPPSIRPEDILTLITSLRPSSPPPSFILNTSHHPLSGGQCHIYVLHFPSPDNTTWAVRIPIHTSHNSPKIITHIISDEVFILHLLETCGFSWSPRLIHHDSSFDNPIGFPYMILSWIEGRALEWSDELPEGRENRNKILRQMAHIMLELANCTKESSTPVIPATDYLTSIIDRKIIRVSNGKLPDLQLQDCFILRALARKVIHPTLENSPIVLSHEDLAGQNIIIDEDYNIKGIIDWGFARRLPLQFAIGFPRFLSIESPQGDMAIPSDIAALSSDFLQPSSVLQIDRQYFISCVSSVATTLDNHSSQFGMTSIAESMVMVLSALNVDWRRLIFEAAISKGTHKWMVKVSWLLRSKRSEGIGIESISLVEEVEGFLIGNIGEKSELNREVLLNVIQSQN